MTKLTPSPLMTKRSTLHRRMLAIVGLLNVSKSAMDQPFQHKKTASTEETTTICCILLSATQGKAIITYTNHVTSTVQVNGLLASAAAKWNI